MYRIEAGRFEVLLAHPGGPYFQRRDEGAWTIPKGEIDPHEEPMEAALREFEEETGFRPSGPFLELQPITQKGGKRVQAWAFRGNCDPATSVSNTVTLEWPPRSGRYQAYPEIDRVEFFSFEAAARKIKSTQQPLLDELARTLEHTAPDGPSSTL